jgi:microtubule-associated protein-like 5
VHRDGVHLIEFIDSDHYLVSCGIRVRSPILIHSLHNYQLLVSTLVTD